MFRSRRTTLVATALAAVLGAAPAHGGPPRAEAESLRWAEATWVVRKGGKIHSYTVLAAHSMLVGGRELAMAGFGKRTCDARTKVMDCLPAIRGSDVIDPQDFSFDPLLREASLDVRFEERRHRIRWTATGDHDVHAYHAYLGPPIFLSHVLLLAGVSVSRDAVASGRLYGRRLTADSLLEQETWLSDTRGALLLAHR